MPKKIQFNFSSLKFLSHTYLLLALLMVLPLHNSIALQCGGVALRLVCDYLSEEDVVLSLSLVNSVWSNALHGLSVRVDRLWKEPVKIEALLNSEAFLRFASKWVITGISIDFQGNPWTILSRVVPIDLKSLVVLHAYNVGLDKPKQFPKQGLDYILDETLSLRDLEIYFEITRKILVENVEWEKVIRKLVSFLGSYDSFETNILKLPFSNKNFARSIWMLETYKSRCSAKTVVNAVRHLVNDDGEHLFFDKKLDAAILEVLVAHGTDNLEILLWAIKYALFCYPTDFQEVLVNPESEDIFNIQENVLNYISMDVVSPTGIGAFTWPSSNLVPSKKHQVNINSLPKHLEGTKYIRSLLNKLFICIQTRTNQENASATALLFSNIHSRLPSEGIVFLLKMLLRSNGKDIHRTAMEIVSSHFEPDLQSGKPILVDMAIMECVLLNFLPQNRNDPVMPVILVPSLLNVFLKIPASIIYKMPQLIPVMAAWCSRAERILLGDESAIQVQLGKCSCSKTDIVQAAQEIITKTLIMVGELIECNDEQSTWSLCRQARTIGHIFEISICWVTGNEEANIDTRLAIASGIFYLNRTTQGGLESVDNLMHFLFEMVPYIPAEALPDAIHFASHLAKEKKSEFSGAYVHMVEDFVRKIPSDWDIYLTVVSDMLATIGQIIVNEVQFEIALNCSLFILDDFYSHESLNLVQLALRTIDKLGSLRIRASIANRRNSNRLIRNSFTKVEKKLKNCLTTESMDTMSQCLEDVACNLSV